MKLTVKETSENLNCDTAIASALQPAVTGKKTDVHAVKLCMDKELFQPDYKAYRNQKLLLG